MPGDPLAYFISFHTYGTWLHGRVAGSVDRQHNTFGEPFVPPDADREASSRERMGGEPFTLEESRRGIVHHTVQDVCQHRGWRVLALHVRTNHVHVVVNAPQHTPDRVMNDLKSWCTRRLREHALATPNQTVWARHGSTEYLWKEDQVAAASDYVANRQGHALPMKPPPGVK